MDPDSRRLRVTVTDGRGRPVPDDGLGRWLAAVSPARDGGEVGIALVSDRHIRTLNLRYRGKDVVTDVLSFAADNDSLFDQARSGRGASTGDPRPPLYLGDIVIARGIARRQARQAGHSSGTEFRVLALHGLLHLLGYDHEADGDNGRMARLEARLRRKGGLGEGLIDRADKLAGVGRAGNRLRPATARRAGVGPRSHTK